MKRQILTTILLPIVAALTLSKHYAQEVTQAHGAESYVPEAYAPKVGAEHPEITLPRIDNREAVSLSQFRGKKVLLIHFASW